MTNKKILKKEHPTLVTTPNIPYKSSYFNGMRGQEWENEK